MDIEKLKPNHWNYNRMTKEEYEQLKTDIKVRITKEQKWFLKKILIRPTSDGLFEIVDGEQKIKICKQLGLKEIPDKYIERRNMTDDEVKVYINSSKKRGSLEDPIKKAEVFLSERKKGFTDTKIAKMFHSERTRVSRTIGMLSNVHSDIIDDYRKCAPEHITQKHFEVLGRYGEELQKDAYKWLKENYDVSANKLQEVMEETKRSIEKGEEEIYDEMYHQHEMDYVKIPTNAIIKCPECKREFRIMHPAIPKGRHTLNKI